MKKQIVNNPRYPHHVTISRVVSASSDNNPFTRIQGGSTSVTIYDGDGRSFTDTTTDGTGKVDINKRKASIPMRFDSWKADEDDASLALWPLDGDEIAVTIGSVTERGRVKDFEPDNNRSIIYWELNRNVV